MTSTDGWVDSSYEPDGGCHGNRVEVAITDHGAMIGVRNSSHPDRPVLFFAPHEWDAFLEGAADGEFTPERLERSELGGEKS